MACWGRHTAPASESRGLHAEPHGAPVQPVSSPRLCVQPSGAERSHCDGAWYQAGGEFGGSEHTALTQFPLCCACAQGLSFTPARVCACVYACACVCWGCGLLSEARWGHMGALLACADHT